MKWIKNDNEEKRNRRMLFRFFNQKEGITMNQWPMIWQQIQLLIYTAPATLLALTVHETCHGLVSTWLGDPTPREEGRLSLNPLHHLDPIGTICMMLFHFGWAKPVKVNPGCYKKPKLGMALTALGGPLSNFILAFLFMGLYTCLFQQGWAFLPSIFSGRATFSEGIRSYLFLFIQYSAILNIGLGVFNLIPVPPLDGSKIFGSLLPDSLYFRLMRYERYGTLILLALLYLDILDTPLAAVRDALIHAFVSFWTLIF